MISPEALLNSMIAVGFKIPEKAVMFFRSNGKFKVDLLDASRMLFSPRYQEPMLPPVPSVAHGVDTTRFITDEKPVRKQCNEDDKVRSISTFRRININVS